MRERMEAMNAQMGDFVEYVRTEMLGRVQQTQQAGLVPLIPRRPAAGAGDAWLSNQKEIRRSSLRDDNPTLS